MRVEHGGQREGRPGRARGRQLVRAFRRQRPGGQHGGGDAVHPDRGHVLAPLAEPAPVLPAAQPVQAHHRGGLGQRERQPVQVRAQVEGFGPLVGKVGEPGAQVRQHLAAAEPADRRDPRPGLEGGLRQAGGDDDLPGLARGPEVFQVSQADQVVEDQRPRAPGVRQPAGEAARGGLGGQRLIGRADRPGRLREAGDDRLPAGRRDPDQRVDRAGTPQRVAERHRDLCLARAALARGRGGGLLAVGQHHGVPRVQAHPEVQPGFRALVEGFGERRDGPGQLDRRMRTGPLRHHVDSLSRVAPALRIRLPDAAASAVPAGRHCPAVMATRDERDPSAGAGRLLSARSWRRAPFCTCTTVRYKGMLVVIPRHDHMLGKVREKPLCDLHSRPSWLVRPGPACSTVAMRRLWCLFVMNPG